MISSVAEEILQNGLKCSIDYLRFTLFEMELLDVVTFLGYSREEFTDGAGGNGYKSALRLNGGSLVIYYDGSADMGINVNAPSQALASLFEHFFEHFYKSSEVYTPFGGIAYNVKEFYETQLAYFFAGILARGQFTRIDLACDDMGANYFSLDDIRRFNETNCIASKWRTIRINSSNKIGEYDKKIGDTIYFGQRASAIMLRVYDKKLEKELPSYSPEWVRWELEVHKDNDYANRLAQAFVEGKTVGLVICELLKNYLRLIIRDDENVSRCTTHPTWEAFLNCVESLSLYAAPSERSLEDKKKWLMKQIAPQLAAVACADGDSEFYYEMISNGVMRMNGGLKRLVDKVNPGSVEYARQQVCGL